MRDPSSHVLAAFEDALKRLKEYCAELNLPTKLGPIVSLDTGQSLGVAHPCAAPMPAPSGAARREQDAPPTNGPSEPFLDFPRKERKLLMALFRKGIVPIEDVIRAVWGDTRPKEPEDTLHKLKTRTNERLTAKSKLLEIRREGQTLKLDPI
jgi:hypothetical protein